MAMASRYSEQVKQSVESLINCLICTDRFSDPKVLPCQHTFCLPCLQHFYTSYNDQRIISVSNFPCPQCRKSVYMPQGGLEALPNDFKVGQIQDVFSKINIVGSAISCDICRFDDKVLDVTSFCAQCSKYLCGDCTEQHSTSALFRTHSTVSINSKQTDDLICSHHKEVIKYFCLDCKLALCTVCALSKHSKHDTIDLATAMDRNRANVVQYVDKLKQNLLKFELKAEKFAALTRGRQRQAEKLKETVKKHTRACIAQLRDDEVRINREIDDFGKRVEAEIEKEIEAINVRTKNIKSICDKTDAFLINGGSLELVNKYDNLITQLEQYGGNIGVEEINEYFNEELILVPNNELTIGSLDKAINENLATEEALQKKKTSGDNASSKTGNGDNVLVKIRKLQSKLTNGSGTSISLTQDTEQSVSNRKDLVTSSENTSKVTSDNGNSNSSSNRRRPEVSDTTLASSDTRQNGANTGACAEELAIKSKDKLRLLWRTVDNAHSRDVSFLADGTAIVTEYRDDSDKLQLFDPNGNLINCVACSAQNIIKPWGCAVNHQLDQIIITDHGDRAVKVLDRDLTLKQVWRSLFHKPCGIAVMRNGEYVITDVEKSSLMVSIHTSAGMCKREFANKGSGLEDLMQPNYVAADHHDRIIVSDAALNCIKIFDSRGKMLLKFHAANDPPLQPHGICIDALNNIGVADQSNNMISLFSSDGQFIQNIARVDDKPWGIAAHDNGSLAITTDPSLHMLYAPIIKTF